MDNIKDRNYRMYIGGCIIIKCIGHEEGDRDTMYEQIYISSGLDSMSYFVSHTDWLKNTE